MPCYVFCICLLTNIYQKYKSVALGDQLVISLCVAYGNTWFYLLYTAAERPPADINLFKENCEGSLWCSFSMNQREGLQRPLKGDSEAPDAIGTAVYCVLSGLSSSREYHALVRSFGLNSCQISMPPSRDLCCSKFKAFPQRVLIIPQDCHVS